MKSHPCSLVGAALLASFVVAPHARAGLIVPGSTFTITGTNFVNNYSQSITAQPGTTTVDNGQLSLTQSYIAVDATHEWQQLAFSTGNGGSVAGNVNANWAFQTSGVQFTEPWRFMNFFIYFTENGNAVSGIQPFAGGAFGVVNPNPLNPALGEVFGGSPGGGQIFPSGPNPTFSNGLTQPTFNLFFINPFSFVAAGNVPTSADGVVIGLEFQGQEPFTSPAPEPSSLALCTAGLLSLAVGGWRRRKQAA